MTIKEQYRKERKRVQRLMNRMTKRGYNIGIEMPKIPKRITRGSIRRLQAITPAKLYEKSTYTTTAGETVTGRRGRTLERQRTAKAQRAAAHRRLSKQKPTAPAEPVDGYDTSTGDYTDAWKEEFSHGNVLLRGLQDKIAEIDAAGGSGTANRCRQLLADAIAEYGHDEIARRLDAADPTDIAQIYAGLKYEPNTPNGGAAISILRTILLNRASSAQELAEDAEIAEQDDGINDDTEDWNDAINNAIGDDRQGVTFLQALDEYVDRMPLDVRDRVMDIISYTADKTNVKISERYEMYGSYILDTFADLAENGSYYSDDELEEIYENLEYVFFR